MRFLSTIMRFPSKSFLLATLLTVGASGAMVTPGECQGACGSGSITFCGVANCRPGGSINGTPFDICDAQYEDTLPPFVGPGEKPSGDYECEGVPDPNTGVFC